VCVCVCLQPGQTSSPPSLRLDDSAVEALIRWYCRESGVRNLEKHIEKLYRKVAVKVAARVEAAASKLAPAVVEAAAVAAQPPVVDLEVAPSADSPEVAVPPASTPVAAPLPEVPADPVGAMGLSLSDLFEDDEDWTITDKNLSEYVGKPTFSSDRCVRCAK
jgi:Lon-like ATP-dependent protease